MNKRRCISTLLAPCLFFTLSFQVFAENDRASDMAQKLNQMPDIYGNIQFAEVMMNPRKGITTNEFKDNGSTLGIKHSHALTEGVDAFFKAEFEFAADNRSTSAGINKIDEAYIGLKGDFGSAQVGSDDTVYEWINLIDTSELKRSGTGELAKILIDGAGELARIQFDAAGNIIRNEGDNFQYTSPEISKGLVLGLTVPFDSDTTFGGAAAAKYTFNDFDFGVAYALGRQEGLYEVGDSYGLSARYLMGDLTLIAQYEGRSKGQSLEGRKFWGLEGLYVMGTNIFTLAYSSVSHNPSSLSNTSKIYVQALHNLSSNAYVYLEYYTYTNVYGIKNNDKKVMVAGATYMF